MSDWRIHLARLVVALAGVCGVLGLAAGFSDNRWKLGIQGWLLLGILGTLVALAALADDFRIRWQSRERPK